MEIYPAFMDQEINIVKMSILSKAIYGVNVISIKIPMAFSQKYKKSNAKIHMEPQKTLNRQSTLEKEEQSWRHHTYNFKLYYK